MKSNEDTSGPLGLWGTMGSTRAMDSYVVSSKGARSIVAEFDARASGGAPIAHNIGIWANVVLLEMEANVYWAEPTIVAQGSNSGRFVSENEKKQPLIVK